MDHPRTGHGKHPVARIPPPGPDGEHPLVRPAQPPRPRLAPPVVAAAHHVSLSHLHRVFTEHMDGETLASFIRRQRLAKAHRDLTDPTLMHLPIHAIAARCGIPRAPEFARAFKAAHGLSPASTATRHPPPRPRRARRRPLPEA
nr:helix-turn-helix transcriptional regulator [Kitasatospora fiedleri]